MIFTKIVSCELLTRAKLNARRIPQSRGKLKVFPHISKRSFCENVLELKAGGAFFVPDRCTRSEVLNKSNLDSL